MIVRSILSKFVCKNDFENDFEIIFKKNDFEIVLQKNDFEIVIFEIVIFEERFRNRSSKSTISKSFFSKSLISKSCWSAKDMIAVLEREPQMNKSSLIYKLYHGSPVNLSSE